MTKRAKSFNLRRLVPSFMFNNATVVPGKPGECVLVMTFYSYTKKRPDIANYNFPLSVARRLQAELAAAIQETEQAQAEFQKSDVAKLLDEEDENESV